MPSSMTGYSEALVKKKDLRVNASIKSLNHRFFEISSYRSPDQLRSFEKQAVTLLKENFTRGRFEVSFSVNVPESAKKKITIDWNTAKSYYDSLKKIKSTLKIGGDISISDFISNSDLFITADKSESYGEITKIATTALISAIEKLKKARLKEGTYLVMDINRRMKEIKKKTEIILKLSSSMPLAYAERMRTRLSKINTDNSVNDDKVAELIAVSADKCDISEELSRLAIHLQNFNDIVNAKGECGKKLEFYLQEIHREINTVGSKAIKPEITEQVVLVKSELEKVREQVQNIE